MTATRTWWRATPTSPATRAPADARPRGHRERRGGRRYHGPDRPVVAAPACSQRELAVRRWPGHRLCILADTALVPLAERRGHRVLFVTVCLPTALPGADGVRRGSRPPDAVLRRSALCPPPHGRGAGLRRLHRSSRLRV